MDLPRRLTGFLYSALIAALSAFVTSNLPRLKLKSRSTRRALCGVASMAAAILLTGCASQSIDPPVPNTNAPIWFPSASAPATNSPARVHLVSLPSFAQAFTAVSTNPVTGEICITNLFSRPPGKVLCYVPDTNPPPLTTNILTMNIPWAPTNMDVYLLYSAVQGTPLSNWARIKIMSSDARANPRGVLPTPFYQFTDCFTNQQRFYALLYRSPNNNTNQTSQ